MSNPNNSFEIKTSNLKERYNKEIIPALKAELGIKNSLALPRLKKVVLNVGIGDAKLNSKIKDAVRETLVSITGQVPVVRKAKKAISGFKIREGDEVGMTVTLRGAAMYDFVDKLAHITLPRLRDFRGIDPSKIDKGGNISLGFKEQVIFPEITTQKAEILHGLEVTMVTNSNSAELTQKLLEKIGFPFKKPLEESRGKGAI
jgi:large subunit ribosomal protein L5